VTVLYASTQLDEVRAALARAIDARGFTLETSEGNRVVARMTARGVSLRVAIEFTETQAIAPTSTRTACASSRPPARAATTAG
jgi:hypothetical protein